MSTTSTKPWQCERTSLTPGISIRGMSSAVTQKARRRTKLPIRSWYAQNSSSSLWHRKHAQLQSILYLMKIQGNTQGNMHSCNQYCTQWKFKDIHRKTCTVAINTVLNENSRTYTGKHAQLQSILYSMKIQGLYIHNSILRQMLESMLRQTIVCVCSQDYIKDLVFWMGQMTFYVRTLCIFLTFVLTKGHFRWSHRRVVDVNLNCQSDL